MDHRDSSRFGSTGSGDSFAGLRAPFARVASGPAERRWAIGRIGFGVAVVVGLILFTFTSGTRALHSAVEWLYQRDSYLADFSEIVLEPPPPTWIKSGGEGLLERVRKRSGRPERISVLGLDLKALANDFRRESPWILAVDRVERRFPNQLTVHLAYRRPAAALRIGGGIVVLDRDAVVLPEDDLNRSSAPVIDLLGVVPSETDPSTLEALPGKMFTIQGRESDNSAGERVSDACRLAGFFVDRHAAGPDAEAKLAIKAIHRVGDHFFVEAATATMIFWDQAPGSEAPGDPKSSEKWAMLETWLESHALSSVQNPSFLGFQADHVVVRVGRSG